MFRRNRISSDEEGVADKLKSARLEKKFSLEEVSKKINVNVRHLDAIEKENYDHLPKGVYQKTFIKKYASFLGLDPEKIEAAYGLEIGVRNNPAQNVFGRKKINKSALLVFPKIFRSALVVFAILAIFLYLGFYLKNSLAKPQIEIFEPADNLITEKNAVYVSGKAEEKTQIEINEQPILKDNDGGFRVLVELKKGINEISISAQNKYSQKRIIKKQVLVK